MNVGRNENLVPLVFTNGCFDIIHSGHVGLLEFAASHGRLIVGLNSDSSIKRIKGPQRPINNELDRMKVLSAMKAVSEVIIFDEDSPYELIKKLNPSIIVKGGDYLKNEVIGADICEVKIYPYEKNRSTSSIIAKIIQKNYHSDD